jgi:hypothetical protein
VFCARVHGDLAGVTRPVERGRALLQLVGGDGGRGGGRGGGDVKRDRGPREGVV